MTETLDVVEICELCGEKLGNAAGVRIACCTDDHCGRVACEHLVELEDGDAKCVEGGCA